MRHSWKQTKKNKKKTQKIIKQHKKQTAHTTTSNNKHIHVSLFCVLLCLLSSLFTYKGTCGIVGNKKKQNNTSTSKGTNITKKTNSTDNNKQQPHTCFLFCVLFCLLCSFLTDTGTCGIVGDKKKAN